MPVNASAPEILAAPTTPFGAGGEVLFEGFATNLARLAPVVDGVFLPGTTGEFPALSPDEQRRLITIALEAFGPGRVVAHVGAASTRQALELASAAAEAGAIRFAAITPYYLKASVSGCADYYAALVRELADGQVYGYLFPDVAGSDIVPDELGALVDAGLSGVKVSGTASTRATAYLLAAPDGFRLWSGNDADLPNVLAAGGVGTVSGVAGVSPQPWATYRDAVAAGNEVAAAAAQQAIEALVGELGPSISRLKYGLDTIGGIGGACRMSIDGPDEPTRTAIKHLLAESC